MPGARPQSGHDREAARPRRLVVLLLLQHDLGVAAEVGEVTPGLEGQPRHRLIEVVGQGAEHGVVAAHGREHRRMIVGVEAHGAEPGTRVGQENRQPFRLDVGERDFGNLGILEQAPGGRAALKAPTKDEHFHDQHPLESSLQI